MVQQIRMTRILNDKCDAYSKLLRIKVMFLYVTFKDNDTTKKVISLGYHMNVWQPQDICELYAS